MESGGVGEAPALRGRAVIDASVLQRLRHVKVANPRLDLARFPDFLIVGPQRTGTTWLHANLRFHPQIFLSEPKELFFFSRLKTPEHPKFQSNDLGWYLRFFRDPAWRWLVKTALCLRQNRALYRPRVRGEATASYAAIDADVIAEVAALNPDVKVILMIRNPIDRVWSHAKKDLARNRGRKLADVGDDELHAFFADPYQRRCAQYVQNCDNWAAHLKRGHLLVCLFDDVATQPEQLLLEVMSFLGVDAEKRYVPKEVRESVNPTESSKIPDRHRMLLEELLAADIAALRDRFGLSWPLGPHPLTIHLPE